MAWGWILPQSTPESTQYSPPPPFWAKTPYTPLPPCFGPKKPIFDPFSGPPLPLIKDIFSSKKGQKRIAGNGHRRFFCSKLGFRTPFWTPPKMPIFEGFRGVGGKWPFWTPEPLFGQNHPPPPFLAKTPYAPVGDDIGPQLVGSQRPKNKFLASSAKWIFC